jgi:hypothetical protein
VKATLYVGIVLVAVLLVAVVAWSVKGARRRSTFVPTRRFA